MLREIAMNTIFLTDKLTAKKFDETPKSVSSEESKPPKFKDL